MIKKCMALFSALLILAPTQTLTNMTRTMNRSRLGSPLHVITIEKDECDSAKNKAYTKKTTFEAYPRTILDEINRSNQIASTAFNFSASGCLVSGLATLAYGVMKNGKLLDNTGILLGCATAVCAYVSTLYMNVLLNTAVQKEAWIDPIEVNQGKVSLVPAKYHEPVIATINKANPNLIWIIVSEESIEKTQESA